MLTLICKTNREEKHIALDRAAIQSKYALNAGLKQVSLKSLKDITPRLNLGWHKTAIIEHKLKI